MVGTLLTTSSDGSSRVNKALLAGFAVTLAAMLCLIKRQELTYAISLFPFLMPLAGGLWTSTPMSGLRLGFRVTTALCLGLSLVLYVNFAIHFVGRTHSFESVSAQTHRLVPDSRLRLAGPPILWFTWPTENFRDLGAVISVTLFK